jgi:competence protein ComEC
MLAINPFLIYDIGFQLSYAAVASLLMYNKSVSGLFEPENGFLQLGWSSISTSLSAQILTTPLVLFHFHQFPLIFILSNIIAIPLSSIALLLLILICIFASFPLIATSIASITGYCIWLMNDRIIQLASLPFSTLNNIPFSAGDLLLSLISIGLFTFYLKEKNTLALKVFLITLLFWSILYHNSS